MSVDASKLPDSETTFVRSEIEAMLILLDEGHPANRDATVELTVRSLIEHFKTTQQSEDEDPPTFRCPECGSCRELLPNDPERCFACHYGADKSLNAIGDDKLREMMATFQPHLEGGQPLVSLHWDMWQRVLAMATLQALREEGSLAEELVSRLSTLPVVTFDNGYLVQALPKAELLAILAQHGVPVK